MEMFEAAMCEIIKSKTNLINAHEYAISSEKIIFIEKINLVINDTSTIIESEICRELDLNLLGDNTDHNANISASY